MQLEKKLERRLFVITNHTHYLNVRKYIDSHEQGKNYILLLVNLYEGYSDLLKKVENDKDLELLGEMFSPKQRKPPFHYLGIFSTMIKIRDIAKGSGNFDKIFFTNYNSWIQHFVLKQYSEGQKVYISDGTAIFPVARRRKNDITIPFQGNKLFLKYILKLDPIEQLHFYSPVNLDLAEYDSLEVFTYDSRKESKVDPNKIYFIGGPLVELEKLEEEVNLRFLRHLKQMFPGKEIIYFAHRREKEKNLKKYDFLDRVIRDDLSFEERLAQEEFLPAKIISYFSSVLINLAPVYSQIEFLYISLQPEDIIDKNGFGSRYKILKENFKAVGAKNLKEFDVEIER